MKYFSEREKNDRLQYNDQVEHYKRLRVPAIADLIPFLFFFFNASINSLFAPQIFPNTMNLLFSTSFSLIFSRSLDSLHSHSFSVAARSLIAIYNVNRPEFPTHCRGIERIGFDLTRRKRSVAAASFEWARNSCMRIQFDSLSNFKSKFFQIIIYCNFKDHYETFKFLIIFLLSFIISLLSFIIIY